MFLVEKLRKLCDPTTITVCDNFKRPINVDEVKKAVREGRMLGYDDAGIGSRKHHIERVAYLVIHGWDDPIEVDVGVPSLGNYSDWPILDGNHRFLAAIVREDRHIKVDASGEVKLINQLCRIR